MKGFCVDLSQQVLMPMLLDYEYDHTANHGALFLLICHIFFYVLSQSFTLRRTATAKPTVTSGTPANGKVTAILEKANAIRQVFKFPLFPFHAFFCCFTFSLSLIMIDIIN